MIRFFRLICTVFLLCGAGAASASFPATSGYKYVAYGLSTGVYKTLSQACADSATQGMADAFVSRSGGRWKAPASARAESGSCVIYAVSGFDGPSAAPKWAEGLAETRVPLFCPANSSQAGEMCTCNSGFKEEGGQCVETLTLDQACGAAFYGNNNWADPVRLEGNVSDGTYCQPMGDSIKPGLACAMNFSKNMAWKTDDGNWHSEGVLQPQMIGGRFQGCVPGLESTEGPPDPAKPPEVPKKQDKTCPNGYQGQVGGETKCVLSYGYNGVDFAPKTTVKDNDKTRTETTTKTECASGKCTTTVTEKVTDKSTGSSTTSSSSTTEVDREWCAKPANKDQCAANGKPAYSGQGTGASSGSGGNGSGGDGEGDDKGGRCGAKGQPPCKIDETGTPDGEGKFDSALDKQAQDHQQRMDTLSGIKNSADKDTSTGTNGGFQWLTHKVCSPWNLGEMRILTETFRIEINICAIEPYVVPVMNFLWILATIWMTFARVASVMGAKVD